MIITYNLVLTLMMVCSPVDNNQCSDLGIIEDSFILGFNLSEEACMTSRGKFIRYSGLSGSASIEDNLYCDGLVSGI